MTQKTAFIIVYLLIAAWVVARLLREKISVFQHRMPMPFHRFLAALVLPVVLWGTFTHPLLSTAANDSRPAVPFDEIIENPTPLAVETAIESDPPELPTPETFEIASTFKAYITQYSRADSCHYPKNGTCLMASGKGVYVGAVACPKSLKLGTKISLNSKVYTCEDRYAQRLDKQRGLPTIDVFVESNPRGRSIEEITVLK